MKLLATLKAQDVEPDAPIFDYASFIPRQAVRAIIFNGDSIALLKVGKHGYYMLPGGGVDDDEDLPVALSREISEELGCGVEIMSEVGSITAYNDRWKKKQTDFCYTARLTDTVGTRRPTEFETEEDHEVVWAKDLSQAIELIQGAEPENRDGKLVRMRDLLFLRATETH